MIRIQAALFHVENLPLQTTACCFILNMRPADNANEAPSVEESIIPVTGSLAALSLSAEVSQE